MWTVAALPQMVVGLALAAVIAAGGVGCGAEFLGFVRSLGEKFPDSKFI